MIGIKPVFGSPFGTLFKPVWGYATFKPCLTNMVAYWQDTWTSDGTKLIDEYATGTHDAIKGQYLDIDVGDTITGFDSSRTITSHSGTATVSLSSGTLSCSVAGTLFDVVLDDGTVYPFSDGSGSVSVPRSESAPVVTLVGFTVPDDWGESVLTGSTALNQTGWSTGVTDGVDRYSEPIDSLGPGWSDDGGGIYSCDGTQTGNSTLARFLVLPSTGLYKIEYNLTVIAGSIGYTTLGGTSDSTTQSETKIVSTTINALSVNDFSIVAFSNFIGSVYNITIEKLYSSRIPASSTTPSQDVFGNTLTYPGTARHNLSVFGWGATLAGTETLTIAHLTGSETVTSSTGTSTPTVGAGSISFTAGTISRLILSDGTKLIFESTFESNQVTIYNVDGTYRHGTLVGATVGVGGIWDYKASSSYLAQYGGQVSGNDVIPYGANTAALTFNNVWDAKKVTDGVEHRTLGKSIGANITESPTDTLTVDTSGAGGDNTVSYQTDIPAGTSNASIVLEVIAQGEVAVYKNGAYTSLGVLSAGSYYITADSLSSIVYFKLYNAGTQVVINSVQKLESQIPYAFVLNQAESKEMAEADTLNEFFTALGVIEDIAPEDVTVTDTERIGTKGFATLSAAQTGDCLSKTNNFAGI